MHYSIIVNPVAGPLSRDQKRTMLAQPAALLKAPIVGLDAATASDFVRCARETTAHCDVLVVAGGDGTLSEIINGMDVSTQTIAYLPMGSGNAMAHALNYRGGALAIAQRIKDAKVLSHDLILCNSQKRAFMASIGIDGQIIRLRDQHRKQGLSGFQSYYKAIFQAYFGQYRPFKVRMDIDGRESQAVNVLSLIITQQPYFGYGMKVAPRARLNDGRLHLVCIRSSMGQLLLGWATAFTIGNRAGKRLKAKRLRVCLNHSSPLQIDGDSAWRGDAFDFKVLRGAWQLKA